MVLHKKNKYPIQIVQIFLFSPRVQIESINFVSLLEAFDKEQI